MADDNMIEPANVIQAVEYYINRELNAARKFDNREPGRAAARPRPPARRGGAQP